MFKARLLVEKLRLEQYKETAQRNILDDNIQFYGKTVYLCVFLINFNALFGAFVFYDSFTRSVLSLTFGIIAVICIMKLTITTDKLNNCYGSRVYVQAIERLRESKYSHAVYVEEKVSYKKRLCNSDVGNEVEFKAIRMMVNDDLERFDKNGVFYARDKVLIDWEALYTKLIKAEMAKDLVD